MNRTPPTHEIGSPFAAVFLDRDGVINEEDGIIHEPDQLRLIAGTALAICQLNELGIPVIVVTNQPVVARGWATEAEVDAIHDRMTAMLAAEGEGATIDAIYFCPHHEHADDPRYRTVCKCRKPRPGLLLQAIEDFDLVPGRCVMIGDRTVDLQAAREAGCGAAWLVETGYGGKDGKCQAVPDRTFPDLAAAVDFIAAGLA